MLFLQKIPQSKCLRHGPNILFQQNLAAAQSVLSGSLSISVHTFLCFLATVERLNQFKLENLATRNKSSVPLSGDLSVVVDDVCIFLSRACHVVYSFTYFLFGEVKEKKSLAGTQIYK